jgi:DNA repair exonuclease SbcCD nuclease subunit
MALSALKQWHPKPMDNAFNLIVFHQSLKEFLPTPDPMAASISLSDLPPGFQLYVDGHLHWHDEVDIEQGKFLLPGSLIFTQMKKLEAEREKGIYIYDTGQKKAEFKPLPVQRQLFYHKIKFNGATPEEVQKKLMEIIRKDLLDMKPMKPLIRVKIQGTLAKGFEPSDIDFSPLLKEFEGRAIFSLTKNFAKESFKKRIAELRELQQSKKSLTEMGLQLLEKNLAQTNFEDAFEIQEIFELLAEGENDKALALLREKSFKKEKPKTEASGQAKLFS